MIQDILSILFKPFKKPLNHSRCYETPRIGCQATVFALEIVWVVKWMICFGSIIHAHMCTNWYIHAQISQNYVQIYRYLYIYIYSSLHLLSQLKKESHREKLGFAENDVGFFALVNPPKLGESTGIIFSWQGLRLPGHRGVFLHAGVTSHDQASVMTSCMKVWMDHG